MTSTPRTAGQARDRDADLIRAKVAGAKLARAELTDADLTCAHIVGAALT